MNKEQSSVRSFHRLIGAYSADRPSAPTTGIRTLRKRLILEEWEEFCEASDSGDVVGVADALADLLYVVYGAGEAWGLDLEPIFAEVHRSNMTKAGGPVRADGKLLKGPDWSPPELEMIIARQFDQGFEAPSPGLEARDG
jgi:predicted HAD superfamily Cof-like phosphohydrolase